MSAWFNFATTRGDIIGKLQNHDVSTVDELHQVLLTESFISIQYPISPKATPMIYKVCQECNASEPLTPEEEASIASGQVAPTCKQCNSGELSWIPNKNQMNVTYTSIGTLFDDSHILIGVNQITNVFKISNEIELEKICQELYGPQITIS